MRVPTQLVVCERVLPAGRCESVQAPVRTRHQRTTVHLYM